MSDESGAAPSRFGLGALEAQVMDVLWDNGPSTIREVIDHLASHPAYTTIATVLTNLDRKRLLTITRQNRSTRYATRTSREQHAAEQIEQVLRASRDRRASILEFINSMPQDDLDLLRSYLDDHDRGKEP
ncbi:putative transcriptional regulator [Salana multivorans]|uniref:Putative transcriptional regulator n=1 Tax=Salana multivorans TaxID=120377 RepID=A0A3N2D937_9MICO|nr:BlaI/MecI/CopY family transcriptional regulator [Salana multivorans]ROR96306.1 putative transcriptional regulator [Salana multivorans]